MTISDAQYRDWLADDGRTRIFLVEAQYHDGIQVRSVYFANRAYTTEPSDSPSNTHYDPVIRSESLAFRRAMPASLLSGSGSGAATEQGWSDIVIDNMTGEYDGWINHGWDGRPLRIYIGDPAWSRADFRLVVDGICAGAVARSKETISLKARDRMQLLTAAVSPDTISGGDADGKSYPVTLGAARNIPCLLVDSATHKYQVHAATAIDAIVDVRDNGLSVSHTDTVASGYFVLTASPAGQITADVRGDKPSGVYSDTTAAIAQRLVQWRCGLGVADMDSASIATFAAACSQKIGLHIPGGGSVQQALDALLAAVGGYYGFTRAGKFTLGRLVDPDSADAPPPSLYLTDADIDQDNGISIKTQYPPLAQLTLGYDRRFTVQQQGLAGAVTEANRAYYSAEYSAKTATAAAAVTDKHLMAAKPPLIGTLLTDATECAAEVSRRLTLYSKPRAVYTLRCSAAPLSLELGQIVHVTHPRFGFAAGLRAVVVGFEESPIDGRVTLEIWR